MIATLVSGLLLGALLLAALLPALIELYHPSDVAPLKVPTDHDNQIQRFAASYRARLQAVFGANLAQALNTAQAPQLAQAHGLQWRPAQASSGAGAEAIDLGQPLVCAGDFELSAGLSLQQELYAAGDITLCEGSTARAVLGEHMVRLQRGSQVLRWLHARAVELGPDSMIGARVSAEQRLEMLPGASLVRAHAPVITVRGPAIDAGVDPAPLAAMQEGPGRQWDAALRRWIVHRALELPPHTLVQGDLVVRGDARFGIGCRIEGSLKVHGQLRLGAGSSVTGSCIVVGPASLGRRCDVGGPLVCEAQLHVDSHCVIGLPSVLTSVSADLIALGEGTTVHGTVWAKSRAEAVAGS